MTIVGILLVVLGVYLLVKPSSVALKLQQFYANYPVVRYAGLQQLRSRNWFIVFLGILFVVLGVLSLAGA